MLQQEEESGDVNRQTSAEDRLGGDRVSEKAKDNSAQNVIWPEASKQATTTTTATASSIIQFCRDETNHIGGGSITKAETSRFGQRTSEKNSKPIGTRIECERRREKPKVLKLGREEEDEDVGKTFSRAVNDTDVGSSSRGQSSEVLCWLIYRVKHLENTDHHLASQGCIVTGIILRQA